MKEVHVCNRSYKSVPIGGGGGNNFHESVMKPSPKLNQKEDTHMNLTDAYNKPLKEILADCNITNQKINSDDTGRIMSIEIKYVPKDVTK